MRRGFIFLYIDDSIYTNITLLKIYIALSVDRNDSYHILLFFIDET